MNLRSLGWTPPGCALRRASLVRSTPVRRGAALLLLAALAPVHGATAQIAVDQLEMVFRAEPGNPRLGIINLRNEGDRAVQAVVKLEDWDRSEEGTNRWYPQGTVAGSCGAMLDIFPRSVSLEPGAAQAVRITLDSTVTLTKECWAAAIVEVAQPRQAGTGVMNVIRTATKLYVMPQGLTQRGEVVAMGRAVLPPRAADSDSVAALAVTFHNSGERHLETRGELQFRRPDNSVAATLPVPAMYTLPGARVTRHVPFPALPAGRYVILAILDYGGDELAAGQIEYVVP